MAETSQISGDLKKLIKEGLFERLPPTFSTYFYDRLKDWEMLFPAEQGYFERLLALLERSDAKAVDELFAPLRAVEAKMGVNEKTWNRREFTLEHVDFLQRSPHLAEWRGTIAGIFAKIDPLLDEEVARTGHSRLVIVVSPPELPMGADRMWTRLKERGKIIRLKLEDEDPLANYLPLLLTGQPQAAKAPSLFDLQGNKSGPRAFDNWIVEAGDSISHWASSGSGWVGFGFDRLQPVREALMDQVDKMVTREQIPGPRQLGERLRQMHPEALQKAVADPLLASFLRSVLLNGNGTLLINNTFVEWASVQAVRRARPTLLCASFGIRSKIKPFSSLLIYTNQEEANPIPTQADMLGSYVDLEVFYQYIWQECEKYAEYRHNTAYLFIGEGMDALFTIAPPDFFLTTVDQPIALTEVFAGARQWLHL